VTSAFPGGHHKNGTAGIVKRPGDRLLATECADRATSSPSDVPNSCVLAPEQQHVWRNSLQ